MSKGSFNTVSLNWCIKIITQVPKIQLIYVVFLWACFVTACLLRNVQINLDIIFYLKANFCHNSLSFIRCHSFLTQLVFGVVLPLIILLTLADRLFPCGLVSVLTVFPSALVKQMRAVDIWVSGGFSLISDTLNCNDWFLNHRSGETSWIWDLGYMGQRPLWKGHKLGKAISALDGKDHKVSEVHCHNNVKHPALSGQGPVAGN